MSTQDNIYRLLNNYSRARISSFQACTAPPPHQNEATQLNVNLARYNNFLFGLGWGDTEKKREKREKNKYEAKAIGHCQSTYSYIP